MNAGASWPAESAGGPATAPPLLELDRLDAGYGDVQVLHGVSLSIRTGDMLALVGSNGAGKTTLLRTISGLVPASGGSVRFLADDVTNASSFDIARRGIAQAPEGRRLFSGMTVEENLRLGAFSRADRSRAATAQSLSRVYHYFPRLKERRRQLAGTLSGGEQQMCAIGRALMAAPRLLMIDELSLGLAPVIVGELVAILHDIHDEGTAVLLVEQDVSVALAICERAVVLQTGRIVLEGPSDALLANDEVVKSYLGG